MQRTQIYLTEDQIKRLDKQAKARGVTRSDLIREIVDERLAAAPQGRTLYDALQEIGPLKLEGFEEARAHMWGTWEKRMATTRVALSASKSKNKKK